MSKLALHIIEVEAEILRLKSAGNGLAATEDWEAWRNVTARAEADAVSVLGLSGAKIRRDWKGASIRLAGIRASSTAGLLGCLQNWVARARANVAVLGDTA